MTDNFFSRLIEGSTILPPDEVTAGFTRNFPEAINIEWYRKRDLFEAIFYKENIEYIAIFDGQGMLEEYRMNLQDSYLPAKLRSELELRGEIMNCVLLNKGNTISYEVILRDASLIRYLLLLNEWGDILSERPL